MSSLKKLACRYGCGAVVNVDERADEVTCGSCVIKLSSIRTKEAMEREPGQCPHHKRYKAVNPPRNGCKTCEKVYKERWEGI